MYKTKMYPTEKYPNRNIPNKNVPIFFFKCTHILVKTYLNQNVPNS